MIDSAITESPEIISGPGRKNQMFQNSIDIIKGFQKEGFSVSEEVDENGQDYYLVDITENEGKKITQYKVFNLRDLEDLYENHLPTEQIKEIDENVAIHVNAVNAKIFEHYTSGELFDLPGYDKDVLIRLLDTIYKNSNYSNYSRKIEEIKSYIDILRRYNISDVIQYFLENPIDMVNPYAVGDDTMVNDREGGVEVYVERGRSFRNITEAEFLDNFLKDLKTFIADIQTYERLQKRNNLEVKNDILEVFGDRKMSQIIYKSNSDFLGFVMDNCHKNGLRDFIQVLDLPVGWSVMNMAFARRASWITQSDIENIIEIIKDKPVEFAQYLNDLYSPDTERNISNRSLWSKLMEEIQDKFRV